MSAGLVNLTGLLFIGFIIWWFWFSQPKALHAQGSGPIEIVVDNGVYTPSIIEVPLGQPVILRFLRRDPSPCAEKVLFDDLNISADLSVGKPQDIAINLDKPGEHEFTCQMHMYRGRLIAH